MSAFIKMKILLCIATYDVLSVSGSINVYILFSHEIPMTHWLQSKVGSSPKFTFWEKIGFLR